MPCSEDIMDLAITLRMPGSLTSSYSLSGFAAAAGASAFAAGAAVSSTTGMPVSMSLRMSRSITRPSGPVASAYLGSTPAFSASVRARGETFRLPSADFVASGAAAFFSSSALGASSAFTAGASAAPPGFSAL